MPTIQKMTLKPADELGPVLTSRGRAAVLRAEIERALSAGEDVEVDLTGTATVSPSFADELFGKLAEHADNERLQFTNVPRTIEPLIRFVVDGRRGPLPA
jgi:hypothetical protein